MSDEQRFRVGILAPMPSELAPVVKAFKLERVGDERLYRGRIGGTDIVATRTGMGTRNAREATERLLDGETVEHVMVVGIAGGMGTTKVGEVFFPAVVVDKDTGTEYKPAPLVGVEPSGKLVTHDDFDMKPDEHRRLAEQGFVAVDMETAAVAAVCEERGQAWSAVRVISDLVGVTPGDVIGLANPDGTPNVKASLRYLVTKPWRVPRLVMLARDSVRAANKAAQTAARIVLADSNNR